MISIASYRGMSSKLSSFYSYILLAEEKEIQVLQDEGRERKMNEKKKKNMYDIATSASILFSYFAKF